MPNKAIAVFTGRSIEHILSEGGSGSWKLDRSHAMRCCKYLVCCRSGVEWVEGTGVGKNERSEKDRYAIHISEYAIIDIHDERGGWQNPVHYTSLAELGINLSHLNFEKLEMME